MNGGSSGLTFLNTRLGSGDASIFAGIGSASQVGAAPQGA